MADNVRQRIVEAATRLFARKGYAGTSTREIVEAAGTTKPSLYYYFGDKEGLYTALVRDELDRLVHSFDLAEDLPLGTALERFCRHYVTFFQSDVSTIALTFRELFGLGEEAIQRMAQGYFDGLRQRVAQLIARGVTRGEVPPSVDPDYSALAILGILNIFLMRWILQGDAYDLSRVLTQIDALVRGWQIHPTG
ncbi:transcriptional regulator, TetR family (plasmid) [Sulfobacillus acidophilus DSM 10332]|uniref:Transcriptional regulator, TetR family n=1 Tax=Sulfobacillus acidophilus (strain ATCC 700253 / DSM 10332 / NAL) TaxID=679936 RepID=G8U1Q1_SULAD|nr:transcriptional regulator, TetR family [Sulfobacillus acidophilus DSM 10332]